MRGRERRPCAPADAADRAGAARRPGAARTRLRAATRDREARTVERRIRDARFPAIKSLDSFDVDAITSLDKTLVLDLARCEFVARRDTVIALGSSGTGKSHVACGIRLAACQRGVKTPLPRPPPFADVSRTGGVPLTHCTSRSWPATARDCCACKSARQLRSAQH